MTTRFLPAETDFLNSLAPTQRAMYEALRACSAAIDEAGVFQLGLGAALVPLSSREEYLAWRADWKALYKALSQQIRAARALSRLLHSANSPVRDAAWPAIRAHHALPVFRQTARKALALRAIGKQESRRAREALVRAA